MDAHTTQPTPYQLATVQKLRTLVHAWLVQIRDTRVIFAQSDIPHLPPNYPLPEEFPVGEFALEGLFRWIDAYDHDQIRHSYRAYFRFHGFPPEPWFPLVWSICSGRVFVGFFELDSRIFHDPSSPLRVDADLVLGGMIESTRTEAEIRLRSRIQHTNSATSDMNVETFELRTFQGHFIMDIAQRLVPPRHCNCGEWLPPAGPDYCVENLICRGG